jgi:hypothetical protein
MSLFFVNPVSKDYTDWKIEMANKVCASNARKGSTAWEEIKTFKLEKGFGVTKEQYRMQNTNLFNYLSVISKIKC